MKQVRTALSFVAGFLTLISWNANASSLSPGLYNLSLKNGLFSQICLASDLSWHTTEGAYTLSGGHWLNDTPDTVAFGTSTTQGVGNISISFSKPGTTAIWIEWTSDLSFINVVEPLKVSFAGGGCT